MPGLTKTLTTFAVAALASASPLAVRQESPSQVITTPESSSTPSTYDWAEGWKTAFPVHQSCNSTLRAQLEVALDETQQLAQHARDHIARWGHKSEFVQKYFGNSSTATAIGWYDRVVAADKTGIWFRCDDPDRNCATQDKWAGHWRGDNATMETVICPLSFEIRRPLSSVCGLGYTVAESALNTYWATDLLHRVLHVPAISEDKVHHYAETYNDALELAKSDPDKTALDSDILQYFAIDVWAYDIAAPGVGCSGEAPEEEEEEEADTPTTTTVSASSPSETAEDNNEHCHSHADGSLHCS